MDIVSQTTDSVALWVSIGVAVVAIAALAIAVGFAWSARVQPRRDDRDRRLFAVPVVDDRVESSRAAEARASELADELAAAQEETRWVRSLAEIGATIDLDEVLSQALAAAGAVPGVDAAMLVVNPLEDGNSEPVVATFRMSAEEAAAHRRAVTSDVAGVRALTLSYRYGGRAPGADEALLQGSLVLPLILDEETIGSLAVFWRGDAPDPSDEVISALEELVAHAARAVRNAQRFRSARHLADVDPLTGLHNRRYFHEALEREVARAHRYTRPLALLLLDVDGFKEINDRHGHLVGDAVIADLGAAVRASARRADIACRVGGDEFCVILPESGLADAQRLFERLDQGVASQTSPTNGVSFSGGVAEISRDETPIAFFHRADEALYRAKRAGKAELRAAKDRLEDTASGGLVGSP